MESTGSAGQTTRGDPGGVAPATPRVGDARGRRERGRTTGRLGPLQVGLAPLELAIMLDAWIESSISYSQSKRTRFRITSSLLKIATLALSAATTIILGLQDLDFWPSVGFILVALVTIVSAVEPFFNWRSRWVLMEEQLYRLYRLRQNLALTIGRTRPEDLSHADVEAFYRTYNHIWETTSERRLQYRRSDQPNG